MKKSLNSTISLETYIVSVLTLALLALFFYGYFLDTSKPISGIGWADQNYYHKVALKISSGEQLSPNDFHYQLNYSLFGSLFYKIGFQHPFSAVSLILFIGSAILLYYGSRYFFNIGFSILFIILVFFFFNSTRTLDYASKIFMVPWNNQLGFFSISLYFFIFSYYFNNYKIISNNKKPKQVRKHYFDNSAIFVGFFTGFVIGGREELSLILLPLFIYYIYLFRVSLKYTLLSLSILLIAYSPNLYYKYQVFNVFFENVRQDGGNATYIELLSNYVSLNRFKDNFAGVVINSSSSEIDPAGRLALLQANPWFYLSPVGLMIFIKKSFFSITEANRPNRYLSMILRNGHFAFLIFISLIIFMAIFYLAGGNMSIHKLRFHCLRYISFLWIPLSFLTTYFINEIHLRLLKSE